MTLTRLHDYYEMNFLERRKSKETKNHYFSDDSDDVNKICDSINTGLIFDKKCWKFSYLQSYFVWLDSTISIEESKKEGIFIFNSLNNYWPSSCLVSKSAYEQINEKCFKGEGDILLATTISNPIFWINSLVEEPILNSINMILPPRRKKQKKSLRSILGNLDLPVIPQHFPVPAR